MKTSAVAQNSNGAVHPNFSAKLKEASLFGAFTEVSTPRFHKYLFQPKHILRNGWLLDPDLELGQRSVRAYILGDLPTQEDNSNTLGQRLEIDRQNRTATLQTYVAEQSQTIKFDMTSLEVIENSFA